MSREAIVLTGMQNEEEVSGFCCQEGPGAQDLEDFLKHDALQYEGDHLGRTYLGWSDEQLVGYLTLSAGSVRFHAEGEKAQTEAGLDHIRFAMPGVLLGRLAVDDRYRSHGFGRDLFQWALGLARDHTAPFVGCRWLFIDAYACRRDWYEVQGCKIAGKAPVGVSGSDTIKMCFDLFPPEQLNLEFADE
jgi:GNAT superfamily N-acetyltransferase